MADFNIKTGDLLPEIAATLKNADGTVISLLNASRVQFHMRLRGTTVLLVDGDCSIDDAAGGQVSYEWQEGDFSAAGEYEGEFEITYTSGKVLTVPNNKHLSIVITGELG